MGLVWFFGLVVLLAVLRRVWRARSSKSFEWKQNGKRVWLVTGGASGIGKGTVAEILKRTADNENERVVACDLNESALKEAWGKNPRVLCVTLDISSWDSWQACMKTVHETKGFGAVDIHLNVAGVVHSANFMDLPEDKWQRAVDLTLGVNVRGLACGTRAAALEFENRRGIIVNVTSLVSVTPGFPGCAIYGASKAAARSFTLALTFELKADPRYQQIELVAVAPDAVRTPLLDAIHDSNSAKVAFTQPLEVQDVVSAILDHAIPNCAHVREVWVPVYRGIIARFADVIIDSSLAEALIWVSDTWGSWEHQRYVRSTGSKDKSQ